MNKESDNEVLNKSKFRDYDNITDVEDEESDEEEVIEVSIPKQDQRNKTSFKLSIKCRQCDFKTNNNGELKKHISSKHPVSVPKFKCNFCNYEATHENTLRKHKMVSIGHSIERKKTENTSSHKCFDCEMQFNSKLSLNNHKSSAHINQNEKIKCNLCDFTAINKETSAKHMKVAMGHIKNANCKFFMRGNCSKGNLSFRGMNRTYAQNNRQCRYGPNCFKFPNCGFKHNEICKYQENCFKQENCMFVHLKSNIFLGGPYPQ